MTACEACHSPIPGEYHVPSVVAIGFVYHPPAFCGQCGAPYPWTAERLAAARVVVEDEDLLSADEKQQLLEALPDLVRDVPMTQASAGRFKRMAGKFGKGTAESLRELPVDIASEAAKKIIWPS